MIYLASPYTAPTKEGREENYQRVLRFAGKLLAKKHKVWSPIVHNHVLAQLYDLPKDHEFWSDYNHDFIRRCDELIVACIPGWKESKGVTDEIAFAKTIGIPVSFFLDEGDL